MPSLSSTKPVEINNQSIVIHNTNQIYIPVSKVANTSIKRAILDEGINTTEFIEKTDIFNYKNKGYEVVAVVRHPFDRLVSCWCFFTQRQPKYKDKWEFPETIDTFQEFLKGVIRAPDEISNKHFRSQFALLSYYGEYLPDITVKFESFIQDLPKILPLHNLQHFQSSPNRSPKYQDYYKSFSPEFIHRIRDRFWKDFEYFEYCWG